MPARSRLRQLAVIVPLTTVLLLGPPSIRVTPVTDRASAPTPGAVLAVTAKHHSDTEPLTVTGRIEGLSGGRRVTRPLVVTPAGTRGSYGVAPQWELGKPWVLVFTTTMGDHGTANALVRITADGTVAGIESPDALRAIGTPLAPDAVERAVVAALRSLGAK